MKEIAAELLPHLEKAFEGVPGRHLKRNVLGGTVGVRDVGISRRHDDFVWYVLLQSRRFYA